MFRRHRFEASMDDELRFHMEAFADDLVRSGLPRDEAMRRARLEFGGLESVKDDCRQARGLRLVDEAWQDLRYAGRSLRRTPLFAVCAILTLGFGIGANAALFSVTRAVVLDTLPVRQPEQLVEIGCINPNNPEEACRTHFPGYLMYREHTELLSGVFAFAPTPDLSASIDGRAEVVAGLMLSGNAFPVLDMSPRVGRLLTPVDDEIGAPLVTVLSYEFWQRRFGGDPSVVERTLRL